MSVAYDHYPELHRLVEQLRPEAAPAARAALLRLVGAEEDPRLTALPTFDGPEDLSDRMDAELFEGQ
ncbi:hypothetical protein FEK35_06810 [Nocardia cyriacigeorgica]|uniref:Uncharacterized protein n=2 Tax=Nocardia cyriacigeorgica TaxID=135487 RepID=A0A5R8PII7_9NOCA|nr:hypothetical protein [Nocardia cyriacigeorgica]MBF6286276.1 hypothetical protein [Nocardia cyriacigeorgica]TLG14864.1 hypothetical protein FEK35_06810 [Nocardia cyriacigeorgica]